MAETGAPLRRSTRERKPKKYYDTDHVDIETVDVHEQLEILKQLQRSKSKSEPGEQADEGLCSKSKPQKTTSNFKSTLISSPKLKIVSPEIEKLLELKARLELLTATETQQETGAVLSNDNSEFTNEVDKLFQDLSSINVSIYLLRDTGVGKIVAALIKSSRKGSQIWQLATSLRRLWKYQLLHPTEYIAKLQENEQERIGKKRKRPSTKGTESFTLHSITQYRNIYLSKQCPLEISPLILSKEPSGRVKVVGYRDDVVELDTFKDIRRGDYILRVGKLDVNSNTSCEEVHDQITKLVNGASNIPHTLEFSRENELKISKTFVLQGVEIDPAELYETVNEFGGIDEVLAKKTMTKVRRKMNLPFTTSSSNTLKKAYVEYFQEL